MSPHDHDLVREIRGMKGQLAFLAFAFFAMLGFQTFELIRDRVALNNVRTTQEPTIEQSVKIRQQLEAVGGGIARLSDAGNANARIIVDDMRRQGITVRNPQAGVPPQ